MYVKNIIYNVRSNQHKLTRPKVSYIYVKNIIYSYSKNSKLENSQKLLKPLVYVENHLKTLNNTLQNY